MNTSSSLLLGLVCLFPAVYSFYWGIVYTKRRQHKFVSEIELAHYGLTIKGQIVGHKILAKYSNYLHLPFLKPVHFLTYSYECDGKAYFYRQYVSKETFHRLKDGESVDLLYLPDEPLTVTLAVIDKTCLESRFLTQYRTGYFIVAAFCVVLGMLVVIFRW